MTVPPVLAEPITDEAPRPVGRVLMAQYWRDVVFLHWPADPAAVAPLLPASVQPDLLDGATYVGLIALRMCRTAPLGLAPIPYLSWFPEVNVRVYSVDTQGLRGVVFLSMDAARSLPAALGRLGLGLPYVWSRMRAHHAGDTVTYTSMRRWPGPRGARLRLRVEVGEPVGQPSELERFVTARWGLHTTWYGGRPLYLANEHPRWPLHRACLLDLDQDLIGAAGLPAPADAPVSVLYAPEVRVRAGDPSLVTR